MRTPELKDFSKYDSVFISINGNFLYFLEFYPDETYPIHINSIRWKVSTKGMYSYAYHITDIGQYYDDDTFSDQSALLLGN